MHIVNVPVENAPGWLLAIDTSSELLGVAVTNGTATAELVWPAGRHQTTVLLPAIESVLRRMGLVIADLSAVAVAVGPGTFNGLRAGLGTAKGLALGGGLPLIGVGTLAATVMPVLVPGRLAIGVVAAGRGRVVSAVHAMSGGAGARPVEVGPPANGSIEDLARRLADLTGPLTLVGEIDDAQLAVIAPAVAGTDLWVPPAPARGRRPGGVAAIGYQRWVAGDSDDPDTLDAVYLHGAARSATVPG
ncbi:MAG: TsaB protein, required for threonylcarbamoyladenosine (t(6)A) formation in tRNA [uncultured Thermomicrobiales bacterium]|uniref:TsaB protein, required for threonylcarbamoyladenosine (T(6)A) formation in tRNA n=1 Tax=uncultured Thermomicrobiales bacterium TaxID=1645740 RepID=A0A6J4UQS0_9BACT|nr:MAG: TsaB protein, required for threonylcarbamoyladenosine (t(6)A) formation in tRNA [uncultured Thermomicrobiales bacterium]